MKQPSFTETAKSTRTLWRAAEVTESETVNTNGDMAQLLVEHFNANMVKHAGENNSHSMSVLPRLPHLKKSETDQQVGTNEENAANAFTLNIAGPDVKTTELRYRPIKKASKATTKQIITSIGIISTI